MTDQHGVKVGLSGVYYPYVYIHVNTCQFWVVPVFGTHFLRSRNSRDLARSRRDLSEWHRWFFTGLEKLIMLGPYNIVTYEVWDYIMPYWLESIRTELTLKEREEIKTLLRYNEWPSLVDTIGMYVHGFEKLILPGLKSMSDHHWMRVGSRLKPESLDNWIRCLSSANQMLILSTELFSVFTLNGCSFALCIAWCGQQW